LRILADFIPEQDRLVVIEDTSELQIQKPNILPTECQTDTFKAKITFDDLLKSALRWRPDRIILGEVRGIEARTLLDSFNTGHAGSMATIHANSAEKALHRFANLVMRSHAQSTFSDTEAEIAEAVDFVVHVERRQAAALSARCWRFAAMTATRNASSLSPSSKYNMPRHRHGVRRLLLLAC